MILKGSQRSNARNLSDHLMNELDNDHVALIETRGFMAGDLGGALLEAQAASKATKCTQFLFSLSLNPPGDQVLSDREFRETADRAEQALGLLGQPRAIVTHEKEGRRHAHVVWSRIDVESLTAINLPFFKSKLKDLSRDLFLDHGWELPKGLQANGGKNPLNFTFAEWQQAQRMGVDPREIKQIIGQCWERSDSAKGFINALDQHGYFLAKGDRRDFVVMDFEGNVHSLTRCAGIKAKDARAKLGDPRVLSSVDEARGDLRIKLSNQMRVFIADVKSRHQDEFAPLIQRRDEMRKAHRLERQRLEHGQTERWREETQTRLERLNKGLHGLFDRLTGKSNATRSQNELEARKCAERDQMQRDFMVQSQMDERRTLQSEFANLRAKQKADRHVLAGSVAQSLRNLSKGRSHEQTPSRAKHRAKGPDLSL